VVPLALVMTGAHWPVHGQRELWVALSDPFAAVIVIG